LLPCFEFTPKLALAFVPFVAVAIAVVIIIVNAVAGGIRFGKTNGSFLRLRASSNKPSSSKTCLADSKRMVPMTGIPELGFDSNSLYFQQQ